MERGFVNRGCENYPIFSDGQESLGFFAGRDHIHIGYQNFQDEDYTYSVYCYNDGRIYLGSMARVALLRRDNVHEIKDFIDVVRN